MHIWQTAMMGVMAGAWATRVASIAVCVSALGAGLCAAQTVVDKGAVVTLPGIHASTDVPGCAEANDSGTASLSFDCLNRAVAPRSTPATSLQPAVDVRDRATNQLGLYNAAALGHRMGPNLGTSVQPYRPKATYPIPLVPSR